MDYALEWELLNGMTQFRNYEAASLHNTKKF